MSVGGCKQIMIQMEIPIVILVTILVKLKYDNSILYWECKYNTRSHLFMTVAQRKLDKLRSEWSSSCLLVGFAEMLILTIRFTRCNLNIILGRGKQGLAEYSIKLQFSGVEP